jgi:hypothetical protein
MSILWSRGVAFQSQTWRMRSLGCFAECHEDTQLFNRLVEEPAEKPIVQQTLSKKNGQKIKDLLDFSIRVLLNILECVCEFLVILFEALPTLAREVIPSWPRGNQPISASHKVQWRMVRKLFG